MGQLRARRVMEFAGFALIASCLPLLGPNSLWPGLSALLPTLGSALILAARSPRPLLAPQPFQAIGAWSYSIYLRHWPLIVAIVYFSVDGWPWKAAVFFLALALGFLSHRFVERPASRVLKAGGLGNVWVMATGGGALVAAAFGLWRLDGLPGRVAGDRAIDEDIVRAPSDRVFPPGCRGLSLVTGKLRSCAVGEASAGQDVLVLGDSFAEMWFPRVARLAPRLKAAFEEAMKARYRTVIIAAMWPPYLAQTPATTNLRCEDALQRLRGDVRRIRAVGKNVVIVTTPPYPNTNFVDDLRLRVFQGVPLPQTNTFNFTQNVPYAPDVDRMIWSLATEGATILEPAAVLCPEGVCPLTVNGRPLYADSAHLRASYAAEAGAFLDPVLLGRAAPR